jgi:hypothetical protein
MGAAGPRVIGSMDVEPMTTKMRQQTPLDFACGLR